MATFIALLSKARILQTILPPTHLWQWATMHGAGLTIRRNLGFSVLWRQGQSCDLLYLLSPKHSLCVVSNKGDVCTYVCSDWGISVFEPLWVVSVG